jgi:hypothetical protein
MASAGVRTLVGTVLALNIGSCSEAVDEEEEEEEEESGAAVAVVMILLSDGASLWCLLLVAVRVVAGEEEDRVAVVVWAVGDVIIARPLLGRPGKVHDA